MSLREGWNPPQVDLNIVSGRGGLGDTIARLPAFRYQEQHYKHVKAKIYVQDGWLDLVRYLLPESGHRAYRALSTCPFYLPKPRVEFDMERLTTLNLHLTDHAFLTIMDMLPPTEADRAYPKAPFYIGAGLNYMMKDAGLASAPYVVFTTDYTAPSRQWPSVHVNELARRLRQQGLTPVLLGTSQPIPTGVENDPIKPRRDDGIQTDLFVDFRDRTTLCEALGVMQRAKAVVGVDNGLLHLAHCTDVPVVMGFTTLSPAHRVPVRDMGVPRGCHDAGRAAALTRTIEATVPCGGCQSKGFAINHDWRTCLFDDYACTLTMTADRFWKALQDLNVVK